MVALVSGAQGCMEELYECISNMDCPAGSTCVVYFPGGSGKHSSSYCMQLRLGVEPSDPASGQDSGTSETGGMDSGWDPGTKPGMDPGIDSRSDFGNDAGDEPGTWFDPSSGLTWQNPPYSGTKVWDDAKSYCASLSLAGRGWRLPTISELRSLIRGCAATQTGGSCRVMDSCLSWSTCRDASCVGCTSNQGPAGGCYGPGELSGTCGRYWSSSPVADPGGTAFLVNFDYGRVSNAYPDTGVGVRCVR